MVCARQDQHGRVRDGLVQREFVLRPGAESVGPEGGAGWLVGRLGGGGGRASRARRDRHRHRRLDPPAGVVHRHHRHQADLRPRVALRHDRVRVVARPGRPDGAKRRRLRDAAQRHGVGFDERDSTSLQRADEDYTRYLGQTLVAATTPRQAARGPAHRHAEGILRRGPRRRRARGHRCRTEAIRSARRDAGRGLAAENRAFDPRVLRDRAGGSLVEPVAFRRRALRPSRRGVHAICSTCTRSRAPKASARK